MIRIVSIFACVFGIGILSGCSSISTLKLWNSKPQRATAANPAVEIVCLWEPGEGQNQQGLPSRGFNGQILFFVRGSDSPVMVDGEVTIYEFDDYGPRDTWGQPISVNRVTAEAWNSYLVNGMLGPTYTIFVPYPRTHRDNVNCSLRLKFTPSDGGPVVHSRLTSVTLPGRIREDAATEITDPPPTPLPGLDSGNQLGARTHGAGESRAATIHRWDQSRGFSAGSPRSATAGKIVPVSFEQEVPTAQVELPSEEDQSSRLVLESEEQPVRRRFRLEAIAGQFSN